MSPEISPELCEKFRTWWDKQIGAESMTAFQRIQMAFYAGVKAQEPPMEKCIAGAPLELYQKIRAILIHCNHFDDEAVTYDEAVVKIRELVSLGLAVSETLKDKLVAVQLEHSTHYRSDGNGDWWWSCSCSKLQVPDRAEEKTPDWESCHKRTREHWADVVLALLTQQPVVPERDSIPNEECHPAAARERYVDHYNDGREQVLRELQTKIRNLVLVFKLTEKDVHERDGAEKMREAVLGLFPKEAVMSAGEVQTGREGNKPQEEHIMQFFRFSHLPEKLQDVSREFAKLADIVMTLPRNPERTVALRKLLEAKDAAVRAKLAEG